MGRDRLCCDSRCAGPAVEVATWAAAGEHGQLPRMVLNWFQGEKQPRNSNNPDKLPLPCSIRSYALEPQIPTVRGLPPWIQVPAVWNRLRLI